VALSFCVARHQRKKDCRCMLCLPLSPLLSPAISYTKISRVAIYVQTSDEHYSDVLKRHDMWLMCLSSNPTLKIVCKITVTVSGGRGGLHYLSRDESRRAFKRLISGELTNYRVVRTSPEPLQLPRLNIINRRDQTLSRNITWCLSHSSLRDTVKERDTGIVCCVSLCSPVQSNSV
jgi:hypothetical protein